MTRTSANTPIAPPEPGQVIRDYKLVRLFHETPQAWCFIGTNQHTFPADSRCIVKVSKTFEDGDKLAEEDEHFRLLRASCGDVTEHVKIYYAKGVNFARMFTERIDSFIEPTLDDCRVNVSAFNSDICVDNLVKLPDLRQCRIDARTSVWLFQQFLELYSFYDIMADYYDSPLMQFPMFCDADYLVDPLYHRLVLYGFSGKAYDTTAHQQFRIMAQYFVNWTVFGTDEQGLIYRQLLMDFARLGTPFFWEAYGKLSNTVPTEWLTKHRPFTYRAPGSKSWRQMKVRA